MNLHRSAATPDWEHITPAGYNSWQRVAAASNGIITPANLISLFGLGFVGLGLIVIMSRQYVSGASLLVLGRVADVLDGAVAQKTGTKSPLGEAVDATFDKLGTLATIIVLALTMIIPTLVIVGLILLQGINAVLALLGLQRNKHLHPSQSGKLSMAGIWVSLPIFVLAASGNKPLWILASIIMTLALGIGIVAVMSYARDIK